MPIAIPMSNSYIRRGVKEVVEQSATFVPPHVISQRDSCYLEGSVPEAGLRTTLLRQRNEIFRKTGFLEGNSSDFDFHRVSTPGSDSFVHQEPGPRRGALTQALTPVPEQAT